MKRFFDTIISAGGLTDLLRDSDDTETVVVDCRFNLVQPDQGRQQYRQGHIPGAFYAHLDDDLSSPIVDGSGRHPLPDRERFAALAGAWGIGPDTQVVVYDHAAGAVASRLWWLLRWIGHDQVALLDGGLKAWIAGGGELDTDSPRMVEGAAPAGHPGEHEAAVSTNDLARSLERVTLIDARSAERFRGESEPLDDVAGHVPGALNRPFTDNLGPGGLFLDADELQRQFLSLEGVAAPTNDVDVVHMCGSGVTACHNILAMELAGLGGSRLYVGSWSEWIRDASRPVATED